MQWKTADCAQGANESMSEKHPECPLYNPLNCKEYYNPKLCAFVRKDKECLKKKKPKPKKKASAKASTV
jgi:hypothetical protein